MRSRLLLGILLPVLAIVAINTVSLYRQALHSADVAYDRTLLASAKSIGELLDVTGEGEHLRLQSTVLYSALEPFEADNRSRMYYKVSGFRARSSRAIPTCRPGTAASRTRAPTPRSWTSTTTPITASRCASRCCCSRSPTRGPRHGDDPGGRDAGAAQVLARQILFDTLWRQAALVAVIVLVVVVVVQRAHAPVRELSARMVARSANDLSPLPTPDAPRELCRCSTRRTR
jgi:two-component system sensor histidine kinase TctE